ncbi:MAG: peptidyl-tRNA hydrolase [Candidatus Micrarchaeota archaeon]|nr:MAG: peptidyl-tRNA hydrolase [Candidatus Micrarchaeota archaeon]
MRCDEDIKQVIIIRNDLKMGKGKIASQAAHASLAAYKKVLSLDKKIVECWEENGSKKVVLKIESLDKLNEILRKLEDFNIPYVVIIDRGLTQVEPGTLTAVGIGPWLSESIDRVTRDLKLL